MSDFIIHDCLLTGEQQISLSQTVLLLRFYILCTYKANWTKYISSEKKWNKARRWTSLLNMCLTFLMMTHLTVSCQILQPEPQRGRFSGLFPVMFPLRYTPLTTTWKDTASRCYCGVWQLDSSGLLHTNTRIAYFYWWNTSAIWWETWLVTFIGVWGTRFVALQ